MLAQAPAANAPPPGPAPLNAQGRVLLGGASPQDKGVWLPVFSNANAVAQVKDVPFQPWAKALFDARTIHELEPHTRCKASGVARQFITPYGVEFVEMAQLDRVYIFDIGGPHTYRTIYMDGRSHPADLESTNYGHSIGWWNGNTLMVDSVGFNEDFWMQRRGFAHTEKLHTLESFTRLNDSSIEYRVTIDDPGAYTAEWTDGFNLRWQADQELFEYVCQQANYAHELMVGQKGSTVDRSSPIVP
ncbi:MAG: hypothetical protein V4628_06795 [Pseudomonadota bacterium]